MHLVKRGHFQSRDKDGGHIIRSALAENSYMQTSWLYVLQNRSCSRSNFRLWEYGGFGPFCSCDLDFDPMTFIYELDP